jgi:hypothetical protein
VDRSIRFICWIDTQPSHYQRRPGAVKELLPLDNGKKRKKWNITFEVPITATPNRFRDYEYHRVDEYRITPKETVILSSLTMIQKGILLSSLLYLTTHSGDQGHLLYGKETASIIRFESKQNRWWKGKSVKASNFYSIVQLFFYNVYQKCRM